MAKSHKKALKELTKMVAIYLSHIDKEMKKPSSVDKGKNIAKICNELEMGNDSIMYFDLGYGWKKINRIKGNKR